MKEKDKQKFKREKMVRERIVNKSDDFRKRVK